MNDLSKLKYKIITEFQFEITRLRQENEELRRAREVAEKNYQIVMNDNNALNIKLENLGINHNSQYTK